MKCANIYISQIRIARGINSSVVTNDLELNAS